MALDLSGAFDVQRDQGGGAAMKRVVQSSVDQMRATVEEEVAEEVDEVERKFEEHEGEIAKYRASAKLLEDEVAEKVAAEAEKRQQLLETRVKVQSSSDDRFPWVRPIGFGAYVILLVVASAAVGVLNTSSFRVLSLSDPATVGMSVLLSGIYGGGVHLASKGFGSRRSRGPRFWAATSVLVLLGVGSIVLTLIRGEYFSLLSVTVEPWSFTALQLLADGVAILAAVLYNANDAEAIRQATAELEEASAATADAKVRLEHVRDVLVSEAEQAQFTAMSEGVRRIRQLGSSRAAESYQEFFMTLAQLRKVPDDLTDGLDLSIEVPSEVIGFEAWLDENAERLHRPRRLPDAPGGLFGLPPSA